MSLRERTRPGLGVIEPCLPSPAKAPPVGPDWLHEIKHDGFRIMARRDSAGVRLITRAGNERDQNLHQEKPGRRSAAKLLTKDEARRITANIAKLRERMSAASPLLP